MSDVVIESKLGRITYVVEMVTSQGEMDVIIDIETGEILAIDR